KFFTFYMAKKYDWLIIDIIEEQISLNKYNYSKKYYLKRKHKTYGRITSTLVCSTYLCDAKLKWINISNSKTLIYAFNNHHYQCKSVKNTAEISYFNDIRILYES